ncbi:MAG: class I SAM-dependent methyltransferase [Actinomycetes bacterium]
MTEADRTLDRSLNTELWALLNTQVTDRAARHSWASEEVRWGLFGRAEGELQVLGDVAGRDVVELACGTAYFSAWLARLGARVVAVDLTEAQLRTARRLQRELGPTFPLVQADAEHVPLHSGRFDLVVSEHGAGAWCEPNRWVAEAARLLRPGGRLVFLTNSALSALCVPDDEGVAGDRLLRGPADTYRVRWAGGGVEYHPSHGDWISVLRANGFDVLALHELLAPPGCADSDQYEIVSAQWAARWPAEDLWVAQLSR